MRTFPKISCATCAFHGQSLESDWLVCRRYPPIAPANEPNRSASFPMIGLDGWCGEHKPGSKGEKKCR